MSIDYVKLITALAGHAAVAWSLMCAAPHVWWALGASAAFPGGIQRIAQRSEIPGSSCTT